MSADQTGMRVVTPEAVSKTVYDAVIVGAGVAGAVIAKQLAEHGKSVLIIEAGTSEGLTSEGFQSYVDTFHSAVSKNSNSPYPLNPNALSPTDGTNDYFEEQGPLAINGSYTRVVGGTTMHWEGKALRMLPEDFELKAKYGQGLDWPISYQDIEPYYRKAEYELGVAGDVEEQKALGIPFPDGYVFPMKRIPPSYLDKQVRAGIAGTVVQLKGQPVELQLCTFPQARNRNPIRLLYETSTLNPFRLLHRAAATPAVCRFVLIKRNTMPEEPSLGFRPPGRSICSARRSPPTSRSIPQLGGWWRFTTNTITT